MHILSNIAVHAGSLWNCSSTRSNTANYVIIDWYTSSLFRRVYCPETRRSSLFMPLQWLLEWILNFLNFDFLKSIFGCPQSNGMCLFHFFKFKVMLSCKTQYRTLSWAFLCLFWPDENGRRHLQTTFYIHSLLMHLCDNLTTMCSIDVWHVIYIYYIHIHIHQHECYKFNNFSYVLPLISVRFFTSCITLRNNLKLDFSIPNEIF